MTESLGTDQQVTTVQKVIDWLERAAAHARANPDDYRGMGVADAYASAVRTLRVWPEVLDGR